jgi:hypothetical protein
MKRPSAALVVASAALCFSIAGTGVAANHYLITSTKQIKPSVLARLRGRSGPQGIQGIQGIQGLRGVPGPTGTFDSTSFQVVTSTGNAAIQNSTTGNYAMCPNGMRAIAGGFVLPHGGKVTATESYPQTTPQGWFVSVYNTGPDDTFTIYAVCV